MIENEFEAKHFNAPCERCGTGVAVYEVAVGGDTFDACDGCVPTGRHIVARPITAGRS